VYGAVRLNAAATAPEVRDTYRPACRNPRQPSWLFGSGVCGSAARVRIKTWQVWGLTEKDTKPPPKRRTAKADLRFSLQKRMRLCDSDGIRLCGFQ